ncbi:hypothetical protein KSP40_PGU010282 [Platanthera guangdongensis]|uniref:Uncharacterized protein n=1 Tax=Platanthera guangdongensis TaxID=2320717 RepID=A0ABR2MLH3_9ASPA
MSNLLQLDCNAVPSKRVCMTKYLRSEARQQESDTLGTNGRARKMVSTEELMKTKTTSIPKNGSVNGKVSASVVDVSRRVENGAGLAKSNDVLDVAKTKGKWVADDLYPVDVLKVLPSDESFKWANENYNAWQRTIAIWSFVLSLRIRVLFDSENGHILMYLQKTSRAAARTPQPALHHGITTMRQIVEVGARSPDLHGSVGDESAGEGLLSRR